MIVWKQLQEKKDEKLKEDVEEFNMTFLTNAKLDQTKEALKLLTAATQRSKAKIHKIHNGEEYETITLDCSEAEATVIQSITKQLVEHKYDYVLGSHKHDVDILMISVKKTKEEDGEER